MYKTLVDAVGALLFVGLYHYKGIWTAIQATMVLYGSQWLVGIAIQRRCDPWETAKTALIVGLGGISLLSHNTVWFKWKPTVIYWILAILLAAPRWFPRLQPFLSLQRWGGSQIALSAAQWQQVTTWWIGFFIGIGCLNAGVAYGCSTTTWVYFKLLGISGLLFFFLMGQLWWYTKYHQPAASAQPHGSE